MSTKTSATLLTFDRLDMERLRDFFNLLNKLKYINEVLGIFKNVKHLFKSQRLRALVTMQIPGFSDAPIKSEINNEDSEEPQGLFPEINTSIAEFEALIVWQVGANSNERIPEPFEGIDPDYDAAKKRVEMINGKLEAYLQSIKELFGFKSSKEIKFAHT
jgi:hypothetical protein